MTVMITVTVVSTTMSNVDDYSEHKGGSVVVVAVMIIMIATMTIIRMKTKTMIVVVTAKLTRMMLITVHNSDGSVYCFIDRDSHCYYWLCHRGSCGDDDDDDEY